jgi:hypothetical protein
VRRPACLALISGIFRFDGRPVGHHDARGRRCDARYRKAKQMATPHRADVHEIKVIFVDEPDEITNPMGIKG